MFKELRIIHRLKLYTVKCEMHYEGEPVRYFEVTVKARSRRAAIKKVKEKLIIHPVKANLSK